MYSQLFVKLFFLLSSLFTFAVAIDSQSLTIRQSTTTPSSQTCLDYEITANRSTIGSNGTYRAAFLQKSGTGTMYNARMFAAASKKLPALTADEALNRQCGNWTDIALKGAEANFSMGVVAQFSTQGLPVGIKAGPEVVGICGGVAIIMSLVWVFS